MLAASALAVCLVAPVGLKAATLAPAGVSFSVTSTTDAVDANPGNGVCATSSGACTLRAAIQETNALAGADVIQVPAGTYAIVIVPQNENLANSGDFDITAPVTIVGAGRNATILDGGVPSSSATEIRGRDRLLEIHAGAGDVTVAGLTIREGYSPEQGGGIYNASSGNLRLHDVRVADSYAAKYGGGIANVAAGRVELVGSTFSGNGAKEGGSAIHNAVAGKVSITAGSAIVDNPGSSSASYPITGGAINNEGEGDTIGTIEVLDSTVARNEASSNGGGIYNERDGRIVVERSSITGNRTSSSGAGIYSVSGTVLIRAGTVISDNHAGNLISSGDGGGIYNAGQMSKAGTPGRLEISNSTITGNTATADGAGIHCGLDADLVITDSSITNNAAEGEGGGVSAQSKADLAVSRATFSGNTASVAGGGAYVYAEGLASFTATSFVDNAAGETGGGGLYTDGSGSVSVTRSTFRRNRAVGDGGGLFASSGGEQTISDSLVADNHTEEGGGGVFNSGMVVTLERLSITNNSALLDGGGIKSEGSGQFTIVDTTVSGNSAENGGAFANAADGTMSVFGSTFRDNSARADGGGYLEIGDANSLIENSTLSGNRAGDRGGGVYTDADAELRVTNVTITDNTAHAGSGLSTSVESVNFPVVPATRVILRNTIVAGNHDGINCHGAVFSEGGNLDDGTTCFFSDPSDLTRAGAGLEPLAANGGSTPTHALKQTSVAIDRGVAPCPDADQRGVHRPQNAACDIGAFEFEGTPGPPDSNPLPPPTGPDSDPPTVSLDGKPALRTVDTVAEFRFRADEIARFECVLNPPVASFSGCESPHDYANLALGPNTFQVRAIDAAGNVGPAESYTWRVVEEVDPPETTIILGPTGVTRATAATFTFSANETATFECALDGAVFSPCTTPHSVTALADGSHTFQVRAIDNSFNEDGSPASRTWTVDTTPPETTIGSGPSGLTNDATPEFTFSSEAGAGFECRMDSAAFASCATPFTATPLGEGAHTFEVRATDAAGNVDGTTAARAFTVDTTSPETSIAGPEGLTSDSTPSFEVTSSETGVELECRVDANAFAPCTSPHTTAHLVDGAHVVEARARDAAGNVDTTPATRSVTVDTDAPETTIDAGPSGLTRAAGASIAFSADELASFACSIDGGAFASCTSPLVLGNLADGSHRVDVRATDVAGNSDGSPATRTWTVDTTAPETSITDGPSGLTNDSAPEFAFSSEAGASFECSLDAAAYTACESPLTTVPLLDGPHGFAVRALDEAGNVDETPASRTFTIDTAAPETMIVSGPSALTTDSTPTFELASEAGTTFECSLDAGAFASCSSPLTTAELADGAHTFEVRAVDAAGNVDATPAGRSFTVDTSAPDTTIDSGISGLTTSTSVSFTFSATEASAFECSLGEGAFAACTSPQGYASLSDDSYTFQVRAIDAAGNVDPSPASRTWTVDTAAPETAIQTGPAGLTADSTPTFTFTTTDAGANFQCSLDAAAFASCASPLTTAELADGAHTFEVRAVDEAGNADVTPASRSFTVDATSPDTSIVAGPSGATSDSTPTFEFSSEAGATFECSIDSGLSTACTSPVTTAELPDGAHTFEVRAVDEAGNSDGSPANRAFTVDASSPETTIDSGPVGSTASGSASFAFSASETATFACALDTDEFAACTSPQDYAGLDDGSHTFRVRATDAAGNTDATPASRTWTIDSSKPDTTIEAGPGGATNDSTPTFAFSSEAAATFECRVDAGTFGACSSPHTTDVLPDGTHTFEVRASDAAGNVDATPATRSFTVDTVAPAINLAGPPAQTSSTSAEPTFSASEPVTGFRCALDTAQLAACTSPVNLSGLALGQHSFRVEATDSAGNTGSATHTWTVVPPPDTTAPVVSLAGPPVETTSTTAEMTFAANEPVTGFRCALDTAALAACTSPVNLSNLGLGQHTFRVEANDSAGNLGAATHVWQVMVAPDTTAPVVTISGPPASTPGTTATFTFTADEQAAFRCSLDSAEFANCASGVSYSGLSHGQHLFRVEATDAALNQSVTDYAWTIVDSSAPVVTISNGPISPTSSTTATFQFSANEPVTFRCSLDNGAFANCASGVSYSGLAVGQHVFEVRATDGAGNIGSAGHSWSVTAAPDTTAPVVTITQAPQSGTTASTAQFAFSANEAATFRCSIDNGPFADCVSGVTYSGLSQGAHLFQVQGRDMAGNVGGANWGWTIASQSPPPPPSGCTAQTLNLASNADTWILESSATSNYGRDSVIKVDTKSGANARVLIRFALPTSVASCTIVDARLRLYAGSYKTGRTLLAFPTGTTWSQTAVTWSSQPAPTGPSASAPSGSGYVEWNVTSLMTASANAGFLVRDATENGPGVEQGFHSLEKGTDNPPVLVVSVR